MPQDQKVRQRYEHEAAERKAERIEAALDDEIDEERLHLENHVHQEGVPVSGSDRRFVTAIDVKEAHALLPDFHRDELRRIQIVAPGQRLSAGDVYLDLRDRGRGELVATGEETVGGELLVSKRETDYVLWDKLIASTDLEQPVAGYSRNDADPMPADRAYEKPTYDSR